VSGSGRNVTSVEAGPVRSTNSTSRDHHTFEKITSSGWSGRKVRTRDPVERRSHPASSSTVITAGSGSQWWRGHGVVTRSVRRPRVAGPRGIAVRSPASRREVRQPVPPDADRRQVDQVGEHREDDRHPAWTSTPSISVGIGPSAPNGGIEDVGSRSSRRLGTSPPPRARVDVE